MAHMMKMTRTAVGHMFNHYGRSDDLEKAAYVIRSNENINSVNTVLNYNLACNDQPLGQLEFLNKRLSEVRVQNRKDVNVMVSWVVTLPQTLNNQGFADEEKFFREAYAFLSERYGKENVISAYVHLDETTPHLHFAFVPVTEDTKRGGFKLSAKEVVNRQDLRTFHKNLSDHMERVFGRDIGILNEATKEGNKSIEELKRQTAAERLREASAKASQIVSTAQDKANALEQVIHALENRQTILEGDIKALEVNLQGRQLQVQEIMDIRPRYETGFLGAVKGIKGVTVSDIENLKVTALKGLEAREKLERLTSEYTRVKALVPTLQMRKESAQDKMRLEQLERAFQRLPESLKKQLLSANDKTRDREREQ